MHLSDPEFTDKYPKAIVWKDKNTFEKQTIKFALDLLADDLIKREGTEIWLTPDGYRRAEELKYWVRTFWNKHWKWIVGTGLGILSVMVAIKSK